MICPVCSEEMSQEDFGLLVEVCENGCKGIWFDHGELQRLDQVGEGMGPALEAALRSPRRHTPPRGTIECPKCWIPMHSHKFGRDKEVNVDECYACGGFFLDAGELKEIRDHYMSDAEVKVYAQQIISHGAPGFEDAERQIERQTKRTDAVGNLTEKILATHYRRTTF